MRSNKALELIDSMRSNPVMRMHRLYNWALFSSNFFIQNEHSVFFYLTNIVQSLTK